MAEDIYYDDLENYDYDVGAVSELKAENALLAERIKEMANTMQAMNKALSKPSVLVEGLQKWMLSFQDEYDDLKQKYNDMNTNFSSLVMTVRAELERKDRIIADLNREKDEIICNKYKTDTYHPPKAPPQDRQQDRKRRNSSIENDVAKRPKSVLMNQRDKNSSWAPTHRDVSKQTEGVKEEDSRIRGANINNSTVTGDRGRRRSDKVQEKTTKSTRSRIKSTPEKQCGQFNTESSKTKNDNNKYRSRKDPHEDSSSCISKRSGYRNESRHGKYEKRSNSGETGYQSRVLRSPSIECKSRNFEGSHRTYGRPKSHRNRTPSRERKRARSRDSREKRYRDRFRSVTKGRFQQDGYESDEKSSNPLDKEIHFPSRDSGCSQDRSVIPLKCETNSPVQCLSNDLITLPENDPRSGQYRNIKEEPDLKMIPLYKDENSSGTNDVRQERCAESPKEWSYESALMSDLYDNVIEIEKYDEPVYQEMSVKVQKLIEDQSSESSKIIRNEEHKKEQRRSIMESKAESTSKAQKEKKNYQNETTPKTNKSKKTNENKKCLMEHNAALTSDNLQSKLPTLENSNNLYNEGLDAPTICSVRKMDEDPNTTTKHVSINTQEPDFRVNDSHKSPDKSEPNERQVTDSDIVVESNSGIVVESDPGIVVESDSGIVVQKEISQNNGDDVEISKNIQDSKENDISTPTSINPTIPNTSHINSTETTHQTVNESTSASEGYNEGMLLSTLNFVKKDNALKMEETIKENREETVCSQENNNISASNIVEINDSKENDVAIGNQNEIPKIISESKDNSKQNKLMIRRRKTVVKRKD